MLSVFVFQCCIAVFIVGLIFANRSKSNKSANYLDIAAQDMVWHRDQTYKRDSNETYKQ